MRKFGGDKIQSQDTFLGVNKFINSCKVEKILKGSMDSISSPSPSMKIQIMCGKVCLRRKGKTLLGIVTTLFVFKSLMTTSSNVLPLHFSHPYLNFYWRWWDQIQDIFLYIFNLILRLVCQLKFVFQSGFFATIKLRKLRGDKIPVEELLYQFVLAKKRLRVLFWTLNPLIICLINVPKRRFSRHVFLARVPSDLTRY